MREYSYYNDVKMITRKSIVFKDGYELFFEECTAREEPILNRLKYN